MKKGNKWFIIGIIIVVIVIVIIVLILNNTNQPKLSQKLTDSDFQISGWYYDSYQYSNVGGNWVANPSKPIDWNKICNYCKNGVPGEVNAGDNSPVTSEQRCTDADWHLSVYASQDLACSAAIDGVGTEDLNKLSGETSNSIIKSGSSDTTFVIGQTGAIASNLDLTKSHDIKVCCTTSERNPTQNGIVCKSATISAKC